MTFANQANNILEGQCQVRNMQNQRNFCFKIFNIFNKLYKMVIIFVNKQIPENIIKVGKGH